jgi:hypothetical protein
MVGNDRELDLSLGDLVYVFDPATMAVQIVRTLSEQSFSVASKTA